MGFPLPTQERFEVQSRYLDTGDDLGTVTDAEKLDRQDRAYHGRFKRWLRPTDDREMDHNITDNRCEPIVAAGVEFLLGNEVRFEVMNDSQTQATGAADDADTTPEDTANNPAEQVDEEAQEYLDAVWDANIKMPTLTEFEINDAVFGHSFLKLIPDDEDMPTAPGGQRIPALAILNPMQVQVTTLPADNRKVMRYSFLYRDIDTAGNLVWCRQLTQKLPNGSWQIADQVKQGSSGFDALSFSSVFSALDQETVMESDLGWVDLPGSPTPWPYPWPPIHDGKNLPEPNSYWGKSDLRLDLIHLNDVLNFLLSNINRILYYHAHPTPVFFGAHTREVNKDPSGAVMLSNVNARVELIEMSATGVTAAREFVKDIRLQMDELSHVPSVAVGEISNLPGVPSGVALKVAYRPLVSQTQIKRQLREALYIKLCQHILELGGFGTERKVVVHWAEMLPSDDLNEAQTAAIWQQIGASRDTLLQRGDFDPDVEAAKREEEAQEEQEQAIAKQQAMVDAGLALTPQQQLAANAQAAQPASQAPGQASTPAVGVPLSGNQLAQASRKVGQPAPAKSTSRASTAPKSGRAPSRRRGG